MFGLVWFSIRGSCQSLSLIENHILVACLPLCFVGGYFQCGVVLHLTGLFVGPPLYLQTTRVTPGHLLIKVSVLRENVLILKLQLSQVIPNVNITPVVLMLYFYF